MQAETIQAQHTCPTHGDVMVERDMKGATYEQKFCGRWFDCPRPGCRNSALEQSDELKAQLAEQEAARYPHEIFVGSVAAMEMLAARGVKALNLETHRWVIVSKTAKYRVVPSKTVEGGASLFCDEDLRAIAKQRGLAIN